MGAAVLAGVGLAVYLWPVVTLSVIVPLLSLFGLSFCFALHRRNARARAEHVWENT